MRKSLTISVVSFLLLLAACKTATKVDRTHAPAAGPAPKIQIGQYQVAQLDNGMKLVVVENHKLPRVSYNMTLDLDPVLEGNKAGYIPMAGELLGAGTTTKTKAQIDDAVDYLGASLNTSPTGVSGGCLKKHTDEFLALMSDVVLNPSFPQDELEKSRKQTLSGLTSEKTDPDAMSAKIGSVMRYGKDHPYGEVPTESTVNNITREDVASYYNTYFKPNVAYLVVVGDITFEEAKAQAIKYFASWKKADVKETKFPSPTAPSGSKVVFVPLAGAVQSVISITYPVDIKPGTNDAIIASVVNNILGGNGFQTRLMQNLREDKAYTYGAYSDISPDEIIGSFDAGASVRNAVTDSAVTEILFEMKRLVTEKVADSTLQTVKNIMTGSFARSLERPQTIANFALSIEKYKLPKDYYETYLQKLNAITSAEVQAMAARIIKPENSYITVVGNAEVAPSLAKFSKSGKVEMMNADGTAFAEMKPAPAGLTAQAVLDTYMNALGGKDALAAIKTYEQSGTMNVSGMALNVSVKVKDSSKFKMAVSMGGMEMMQQVVNGTKGFMSQMGQKEPMDESMIQDTKMQFDLLAEANPSKYGITATLKGMDAVENEEAYVVEMKSADGSVTTDYYSVKSGLKIKSQSVKGEGDESMMSETFYKEYASVSGIRYANKIVEVAGPQSMEFVFTEMKVNTKIDDKEFIVE